jgi:tetratricopeptide (TPR) repeat protein
MKTILFFYLLLTVAACTEIKQPIARYEDYEQYLTSNLVVAHDPIKEEVTFWSNRLQKNPNDESSLLKLAGLYTEAFKTTGLIADIKHSDSLYNKALIQDAENAEIYQSLAANAIAQHRFPDAKNYAEKALSLKDKKAASLLILADVSLEIGDYARANQILDSFKNKNSFAYLIRKAKSRDHEGMTDSAIVCMEKAYERIKNNKILSQWALSNLADMYGHAGRVEKAYATYLDVLRINPRHDHALKGIAWICLSHDGNFRDARKIINTLTIRHFMPEAHLLLATINEMEGNERQRIYHLEKFKSLVSKMGNSSMYNKYLALVEAEEFNPQLAKSIAEQEIVNRATPQSYDLLAWAYYNQENFDAALEIATRKVKGQTFEPDAIYHLGMIYLANGNREMAREYLNQALESEYELGPSISGQIKAALQDI